MVYFVATPIGNLKDITLRALEVLNAVDLIACEDTRHSLKLLNHYGIKKPLVSYHKFNEKESAQKLAALALGGKNVAVISDAGTPLISDPGGALIDELNAGGIEYTVIPGANAILPALILSGFNCTRFTFCGFLTGRISAKRQLLKSLAQHTETLVFYSAPQDIDKDTALMFEIFGERLACAVKEISKVHEKAVKFALSEGLGGEKRGEYVLVVEGNTQPSVPEMSPQEHILYYIDKGMDKRTALKTAAKDRGVSKSELYKYALYIKEKD